MIIPYSTDAPIYHFPRATLGLIAANVAVHLAWNVTSPDAAEPYAMKLGEGLHPLQWLTHNFLHADFLHLTFNMVFLWAYGILVEGKIGWLSFLLCYLGIGTAHGAAIQVAYLHADPSYVLGASAIIFGLMAMAMIWAPMNDLSCLYLFIVGFRVITGTFEWPIYAFALLQIFLELLAVFLTFAFQGDPMSSGLLHLSGACWGLLVGLLVLKMGWVDCENWDVFSLLNKRRGLAKAWKSRGARPDRSKANERLGRGVVVVCDRPAVSSDERIGRSFAKIHRSIEAGDLMAAQAAFDKWMLLIGDFAPRDALLGIIRAFHACEGLAASVPAMRALCRLYPENSERVRLKLSSILLRQLERPADALRHLRQISDEGQEPNFRRHRRKLVDEAERMLAEGVLEIEEDA
jgi:membrane associated rhomboid family serine protease